LKCSEDEGTFVIHHNLQPYEVQMALMSVNKNNSILLRWQLPAWRLS